MRSCGYLMNVRAVQAYLEQATQQGFMLIIASSGPTVRSVAPAGGTTGTLHPNPLAIGIPATPFPMLVDISMVSWPTCPWPPAQGCSGQCEECRQLMRRANCVISGVA